MSSLSMSGAQTARARVRRSVSGTRSSLGRSPAPVSMAYVTSSYETACVWPVRPACLLHARHRLCVLLQSFHVAAVFICSCLSVASLAFLSLAREAQALCAAAVSCLKGPA